MREPVFINQEEINQSKAAILRLQHALQDKNYRYFIESYGCQMNDHDSEKLAGMLEEAGCHKAAHKEEANLILFNTCCVREHAEKRVFGNIGALKKQKEADPSLCIAVCGCMMQQEAVAKRLYKRFPFVDIIFGTHELHRFPLLLEEALAGKRVFVHSDTDGEIAEGLPALRENPFSTNVIIMYGCDNFCTYCIVPYVRGRERSRNSQDILAEVEGLAKAGYKEITLLGQNVNSYKGDGGKMDFPTLLHRIHEVPGISRIRFMTSHPKDLSPGLIAAMASLPKVCNHIHLPVQSGSNRILQAMNRKYTRMDYLRLVEALRRQVQGIEITTDIIVGFPGEREEDFLDTISLVEEVGFSAAYTFMYSPRPGTLAAKMEGQIDEAVKKDRLFRLNQRIAQLLQESNQKYIGQQGEVLIEGCDGRGAETMAFGKLPCFKMVYFPGDTSLIGQLKQVRITAAQSNSLLGELL